MSHYFLKIIISFLVLTFQGCIAADLSDQLVQLQYNLGKLKGKLGTLKTSLSRLKGRLEGRETSEQRLLPDEYYGNQAQGTFDAMQAELFENAETIGYGYKTANLMQLKKLCLLLNELQAVQELGYEFAVPEFFGITSNQIQDFLKIPSINLDVADEWKTIIDQYFTQDTASKTKDYLDTVFENKKFPPGFLEAAKELEIKIKEKFKDIQLGNKSSIDTLITTLTPNQRRELNTLVKKIETQNEKLMVRSTGKEDTDKLANAGGNESIANVSPATAALIQAIGIGENDRLAVVPSYFGAKSLTQRLGAGDRSIIEAPFTPVVIQRMIGEKDNQSLPRCGVMFTEEAEGALSKQRIIDENYKIKTSGISIIQAAFGHNEGVVNSIVTVDTYYVDDSGIIHPLIKQKRFRIKPIGEGKLGRIDNADALVELSTLEPNAVKALKLLANALEDYYKKPMDVEYVILSEGDKKTIYIVQARPIVHDTKQQQASYLDLNHPNIQRLIKLDGQAIGAAGGGLRFISGKEGSIVKKGIGEALTSYQSRDNKNDVQAILIGEMAPATSHEATAFRSESKPVMAVEGDFDTLAGWVEQDSAKLILDTQQQFVAQWGGDFNPKQEDIIKDFIDNNFAKEGWISYPLPQRISIQIDIPSQQRKILFQELNAKLFGGTSLQDKLKNFKLPVKGFPKQLKDLIYRVKTGTPQEAQDALATLWLVFNFIPPQSDYAKQIGQLQAYAALIISNLLENLEIKSNDENYLSKRLFPIHFLETILFQHHKDSEGLYSDSVIKLWTQMKIEKEGVQAVTTPDVYGRLAGTLTQHGLTKELKDTWKDFIESFDSAGKPMQDIVRISKLHRQVAWLQKSLQTLRANKKNEVLTQTLIDDLENLQLELGDQTISDDDKNKAKFYQMLVTLGKLDMLDLWLHTSFVNASKDNSGSNHHLAYIIQESENLIKKYQNTSSYYPNNINALVDLWNKLHSNWKLLQPYDQFKNHKNFPQNPPDQVPIFQDQLQLVKQWEEFIKNWDPRPLTQVIKDSEDLIKEYRKTYPVSSSYTEKNQDALKPLWSKLQSNWNLLQLYDQFKNHKDFPQNPGNSVPMVQDQAEFVKQWEEFIKNWDPRPLTQLIKEFNASEAFLIELLKYKKLIEDVNVAAFEDPSTFLKNWNTFQSDPENILSYFIDDSGFIQKFKNAQGLGKLAALGVMEELVTKFDATIKAVTGSTEFVVTELADNKSFDEIRNNEGFLKKQISTQKDKIFTFHLMLEKYLELLKKWYQLSKSSSIKWEYKGKSIEQVIQTQLNKASNKLQEIQNKTDDLNELQAKIHAEGSAIGSAEGVDASDRIAAKTHEELFTFTHQSLLIVITKFMKEYGIKDEQLPPSVQKLDALIAGKKDQSGTIQGGLRYGIYTPSLVGTLFKNNILTRKYNFPQGLHSAAVKLIYNTKTKQCSLTLSMFGADHFARWERCIDYAEYASLNKNIDQKPQITFLTKGFDATWPLDSKNPESTMSELKNIIQNLCIIAGSNNQNSADKGFDNDQADKVIELCATKYPRIHCFLSLALNSLDQNNIRNDTINNLLTIAGKLLEPGGEYALNSEIFSYRLPLAPDLPGGKGNKEIFYGITPNNFYELAGTQGDPFARAETIINAYKHTNIRAIIAKLIELTDKLSPNQKQDFIKLIKDHQEYIVDQWDTIKVSPTHSGYGQTTLINLATFFDKLSPQEYMIQKEETLSPLVTQSYYGNQTVYNNYYTNPQPAFKKVQPLLDNNLKNLFIQRGNNILRTNGCTKIYQEIRNLMTQAERENFAHLVGDALAHKDYLIRENANKLFAILQTDPALQNTLAPYVEKIHATKVKQLNGLIARIATDATSNSFEQALELISKITNAYARLIFAAIELPRNNTNIKQKFQEVRDDILDQQWKNKFDAVVKAYFCKKLNDGYFKTQGNRYSYSSYNEVYPVVLHIIDTIYEKFPDLIKFADEKLFNSVITLDSLSANGPYNWKNDALKTIANEGTDELERFIKLMGGILKKEPKSIIESFAQGSVQKYTSPLEQPEKIVAALIFLEAEIRTKNFLENAIARAQESLQGYYPQSKELAKKVIQKIIDLWDGLNSMQEPSGYTKKQLQDLI